MKTPKAEKLPSGKWRIRVQINGKRYSVTEVTKEQARERIKLIFAGIKIEEKSPLTVGKAIDKYIALSERNLSPTTIRSYKAMRKSRFQSLMDLNLTSLTENDINRAIKDDYYDGVSVKTLKNAYSLLCSTLKEFRPGFEQKPRFPKGKKRPIVIPDENEMKKIWAEAKGTDYELPILLGSWLGLRQSEIKGLKFSDIQDGRLHVQRAYVRGEKGFVEKGPKTESGDRWIKLPETIETLIKAIEHKSEDEYIVKLSSSTIYDSFKRICQKAGVKVCRFHDLRHFAASEAHLLGVPDKYAMKRMGHSTDNMLRNVYQHTIENKEDQFSDQIDDHMQELYDSTDKKP